MAYIMTTEAEIQQKSGAGVNIAFDTTMMTASNLRAESMVNSHCNYNFSTAYGTLNAATKGILGDICSSFVAIEAISYDTSGYTSPREAEGMISVLRDGMMRNLGIIREKKTQGFIVDPTKGTV